MASSVRLAVQQLIDNNVVMVFSKTFCPYCVKVKDLFNRLGVSFQVVELDRIGEGDQYQAVLREITGASSVPRVFIGGASIGGCDDTHAALRSGDLKARLLRVGLSIA